MRAEPIDLLPGVVAVIAPHMDDEVLGCGGTIALLPRKERVHVIYATDGSRSPVPPTPWVGSASGRLSAMRMAEARSAMQVLGVPQRNIHFLGFPDARLRDHAVELERAIHATLDAIRPTSVLVPFRFDRHPDHLAVNRVAWGPDFRDRCGAERIEYFVYTRWRLLPAGDIRPYIATEHLAEVDTALVAQRKLQSLQCFESQTTRVFDWQHRPNLTGALLDAVCRTPESFLRSDAAPPGAAIFTGLRTWIRLAHVVEPALKQVRDRGAAIVRRPSREVHDDGSP